MSNSRMYFLDNLRSFIIMLMVVFHGALAYMVYAPEWWYVVDHQKNLFFDLFVVFADNFIMPIMFFISGYFGIKSLVKRTASDFWNDKFKVIIAPWIFGSMLIAPIIAFLTPASRYVPISFTEFYKTLFWGPYYQHAHYWYLGFLVLLYVLLVIAHKINPKIGEVSPNTNAPSFLFFLMIGLLGGLGYWAVNLVYADGVWLHPLWLVVFQPTRVPLYLIYFAVGVYAHYKQWFSIGYSPSMKIWLPLFLLFGLAHLTNVFIVPTLGLSPENYKFIRALLHSFFCLSAIFGLISLFKAKFNLTNNFWYSLSISSYAIYYLHQLPILCSNWLVRPLEINVFLKYIIAMVIGVTFTYLVSRYLLIKIPCFGNTKKKLIQ